MAGALCRADPGPVHADPRGREPRRGALGGRAVPAGAQLPRRLRPRTACCNERAVLAHGIWLDDADRAAAARRRRADRLLPQSNLFLGSGLFGWQRRAAAGVPVSLASDVGGGTSLSMRARWPTATRCRRWPGTRLTRLGAAACGHARRGAGAAAGPRDRHARARRVGRPVPVGLGRGRRWHGAAQRVARDLHEKVFAWLTLGDERNLAETWVGRRSGR